MKKPSPLIILSILVIICGCTLPAKGIPPVTLAPESMYTEAVLTIAAEYTQTAAVHSLVEAQETPPPERVDADQPAITPSPGMTDTPLPTPTPTIEITTALPSTTPTPSLSANDPRFGFGEPAFLDRFDDAQNWPIYTDEHVKIVIENGKMAMTARKADFFNSWVLTWVRPVNFYLETSVTASACAGRDRYGIIFRVPDVSVSEGYLFAFSCEGKFSIWYWNGEKEIDLVDWQPSDQILAGAGKMNRIGIRANGNQLSLYANGSLITTLTDARLSEGYFGTFVGSAQTENFTAYFDEIACWEIK